MKMVIVSKHKCHTLKMDGLKKKMNLKLQRRRRMVIIVVDSNFHGNNNDMILIYYLHKQDDDSLIATLCVKYCMIAGRSNATTH